MKYVERPEEWKNDDTYGLFLAGGITGCPDWQSEMRELLAGSPTAPCTILNPRRWNFPIGDPSASEDQIRWEYRHMKRAGVILFWFPAESVCPIALFELGSHLPSQKILAIGVHPEYPRRRDVEIQTKLARPWMNIVYSLDELASQVFPERGNR